MAMSLSRPDPSSPNQIASAAFAPSRKGFDQAEVRDFLRMVAAELARLQEREKFLEREVRAAQRNAPNLAVALDEEVVTRMLGEEAARILATAREGASNIKVRAEEAAERLLREAHDEAQRVREEAVIEAERIRRDASADADAELSMAKQQGREMVNETRAYRERVLSELARRRELARQQIEQLVHGRDRLMQAFERARLAAIDVMAEMAPVGEPDEYVNLSPTTGPVPLMVKNQPAPEAAETSVEIEVITVDEVETLADDEMGDTIEVVDFFEQPTSDTAVEEPAAEELAVVESPVEVEVAVEVEAVVEIEAPVEAAEVVEAAAAEAEVEAESSETLAPVVSLFGTDNDPVIIEESSLAEPDQPAVEPSRAEARASVDGLFAKLRASRTDDVVAKATVTEAPIPEAPAVEASPVEVAPERVVADTVATVVPVVAPAANPKMFEQRDADLTPLIIAAARKAKRVLADEQNDVLHALRGRKGFDPSVLLPPTDEHLERYREAIIDELRAAAVVGASSISTKSEASLRKAIESKGAETPALEMLAATIVQPLRDRLDRAVIDTGADATELGGAVRSIYREWKMQRIDERLDDIVLSAFGHGQLAALSPGTPVCWAVDPNGPACADAEDNSLAGAVPAGEEFPTAHRCAPAHEGCRCMLQPAPR